MTHLLLSTTLLLAVSGAAAGQDRPRPAEYYNPSWSPDSRRLAFESTRDGRFAVYTVHLDGTGLTRLTVDSANNEQPSWSPDGKRIVFTSDRDGHEELYLMNADGSDQVRLTNSPGGGFYQSSFSPDGRWIAFEGRYEQVSNSELLFVVAVDGSGRRQLTDSTTNSVSPHWSPDGRWLAFTQNPRTAPPPRGSTCDVVQAFIRTRDAAQEVAVIRPDGTGLRFLTHNAVNDCCPRWSVDGTAVYFTTTRNGGVAIFAMDPDGSNVRVVAADASMPAWSPDGRTLYFVATRDGTAAAFAMDPDGSNLRRIADTGTVPNLTLSPDGRYFAYTKMVRGSAGVYLFEIASGQERLVAGGP